MNGGDKESKGEGEEQRSGAQTSRRMPAAVAGASAGAVGSAGSGPSAAAAVEAAVSHTPVYTFGKNNYSQLGLEHADASVGHIDQQSTPQLLRFFRDRRVLHVACGYEHSIIVTESNEVFGFGRNDNAQLGLGDTNNSHNTPQRIPTLCGKEIALIRCGAHFALTVTADGEVFGQGANRHGQLGLGHSREQTLPTRVPALSGKGVHALACGGYHSLVATRRNELFVFGKNERAQLGLGEKFARVGQVETPTKLDELCGVQVTHVAGGFRHSVVATADGKVYGFGNNRYGELGMGDARTAEGRPLLRVPSPRVVDRLTGRGVMDLACGEYHTVAVLGDGDVVSFGYNGCGQLGLGHTDSQSEPSRVEALCQKKVWAVECGYYHTVALTEEGSVYGFGYNANGMLGLGHTDEMLVPARLPGLASPQLRVAALCRSHHTILFQAAHSETPASELAAVLATGGDATATINGIVNSVLGAAKPQEKPSEVNAVVKVLAAAVRQAPALARALGKDVNKALAAHGEHYREKVMAARSATQAVTQRQQRGRKSAEAAQARIARLQRKMKEIEREMVAEEATLESSLAEVRMCHREQEEQREVVKLLGVEGQRLKVLAHELGRLSGSEPVRIFDLQSSTGGDDPGAGGGAARSGAGSSGRVESIASATAASRATAAPAPVAPAPVARTSVSGGAPGVTPALMAAQFREMGLEQAAGQCERERLGSTQLVDLAPAALATKLGIAGDSEEMTRVIERVAEDGLNELELDSLGLSTAPQGLLSLTSLRALSLRHNKLRDITGLGGMASLECLALDSNHLTELPQRIVSMVALRTLSVEDNKLRAIPATLPRLPMLQELNLAANELAALPDTFESLASLTALNLHANRMVRLPDAFGSGLAQLRTLQLGANDLRELPDEFGASLGQLEELELQDNKLARLPETFCLMGALQRLCLDNNQMSALPHPFGQLAQLRVLELSHNALRELPESLAQCACMRELRLDDNDLHTLPVAIGELQSLRTLWLFGNEQLHDLPGSFERLQLDELWLRDD
eukprot:g1609.t1